MGDNGGNLSCPGSGGRSEPQVNLIYSEELCRALSGPSAAAFVSSTKVCWTMKQPLTVMFKTFLIPHINMGLDENRSCLLEKIIDYQHGLMHLHIQLHLIAIVILSWLSVTLVVRNLFSVKMAAGSGKWSLMEKAAAKKQRWLSGTQVFQSTLYICI